MQDNQCGIYNNVIDVKLIKTEPASSDIVSTESYYSNDFQSKIEYIQTEETLSRASDPVALNDLAYLCDVASMPTTNDEEAMSSPADFDCDIVNLDLQTDDSHIEDMFEINSPESWNSSHQSFLEHLSVDSRPSTTNTLSTNPSFNELCVICNDLASGKHYGVSACEGCKGFFKRTIRKNLNFTCREFNNCPMTEKLRNRCQSCRFKKCIDRGMKIEAVQKERPSKRKLSLSDSSGVSSPPESVITADSIFRNEMSSSANTGVDCGSVEVDETRLLCSIINDQLFHLVMWAKCVPGFNQLDRSDQMILLNKTWVEIFLASVAFRSTLDSDLCSIKMDDTYRLTLSVATNFGLHHVIVRIIRELVTTLKCMHVDQMEMACLKIIILFDANYAQLKDTDIIRGFRLSIFDILKKYIQDKYPKQPSRIYKLLLKLSSIRGLTACFVQRMRLILHECLQKDNVSDSGVRDSSSEFLFPLFYEMMSQQEFPFS